MEMSFESDVGGTKVYQDDKLVQPKDTKSKLFDAYELFLVSHRLNYYSLFKC